MSSVAKGYLRYGDFIVLEVRLDEEQAEVGVLSMEPVQTAGRRLAETESDIQQKQSLLCVSRFVNGDLGGQRNSRRKQDNAKTPREGGNKKLQRTKTTSGREATAPIADVRNFRPPYDVFVNGVIQIAASQGFEAAGEPVFYGSHIKLVNMHAGQYLCAKEILPESKAVAVTGATSSAHKEVEKSTTIIQLVSPEEMQSNENSKECIFRVMPRFGNLRAEGDRVMFEDLIVISHFSGRCLYRAASDRRIVMSNNPVQKTALRLYPFLHVSPNSHNVLRAGMVVQFYHRVVNAFMTIHRSSRHHRHHHRRDGERNMSVTDGAANADIIFNEESNYDVKAVVRFSTLIDKSGGFWRLETLPINSETSQRRVNGNIRPGSRVRLRHVLYDKYLALKLGDKSEGNRSYHVTLIDCPSTNVAPSSEQHNVGDSMLVLAEFEVHLLHSARPERNGDASQDGSPAFIELGSNLRLRHVISGNFLTVGLDENESNYVFQCSSRDYDKDVYQVLPVRDEELATVATAKLMKTILEELLDAMKSHGHDHETRMQRATIVLQSLVSNADEGFLARHTNTMAESSSSHSAQSLGQVDNFRRAQNIADELGYVALLLKIADQACSRALRAQGKSYGMTEVKPNSATHSMSDVEDELARTAYMVLGTLISGNRDVVESVVEAGGVQLMLQHLDVPTRGTLEWSPPLLELVDASCASGEHPLSLITEDDLTLLLDRISTQISVGHIPSRFIYQFLARVCRPGRNGDERFINHKMQSMICSHILGANPQNEPPFWSLMVYHTFVDEVEGDSGADTSSRPLHGKSRKSLTNQESSYSIYKSKSYLNPRFAELLHQSNEQQNIRRRLLISTTPYGQTRPHVRPLRAVRPPNLPVKACSEEEFIKAVRLRNRISLMAMDPQDVKHFDLDDVVQDEPDFDQLMPHVNTIMQARKWKELQQMTRKERDFYCSSLELVAAMCAGRNILVQTVVKKFLPVDHILLALDTVSIPSPGSMEPGQTPILDPLRPVRTALQHVLYTCYIDSAVLPPIPSSGLDTVIRTESSADFETPAECWDDVFVDECYGKVFSLISQEDDNLIEISDDMHEEDLIMCLRSLDAPYMKAALSVPERMPRHAHAQYAIEVSQREFKFSSAPVGSPDNASHSKELIEYLRCLRDIQKANLSSRNLKSLKQRAYLEFQLLYYIRCQASYDWHEGVQKLLLDFTGPKTGQHDTEEEVSNRSYPVMASVASEELKRSSRRNGSSTAINIRLAARRELEKRRNHAEQIRANIDAILMHLRIIHSLLLRRFFDYEYNANPYVADAKADKHRSPASAARRGKDEDQEIFRRSDDDVELEQTRRSSNRKDGGLYAVFDDVFKDTITEERQRTASELAESAKRHSRSPFYDMVLDEDYAMVPQRVGSGKQVLRLVINGDKYLRTGNNGKNAELWMKRAQLYENAGPIREILATVLSILSDAPGNVIDPRFDLHDDEKQMDEYFKRQYGYSAVPGNGASSSHSETVTDLVAGVIEVKQMCCRIAIACLELLHSRTAGALNQIFFSCFEELQQIKMKAQKKDHRLSMLNMWGTVQSALTQSQVSLSPSESAKFRHQLRAAMERNLSRNYELIWSTPEFFHKETFRILAQQIYFNSPELRAEALNLIFRSNAFHSELAGYLLKKLQESRVEDHKAISYVSRQRSALQQVLSRFHFQRSRRHAHRHVNDDALRESETVNLLFRLNGFKLKKVLMNMDTFHGNIGLISFCFQHDNLPSGSATEAASDDNKPNEAVSGAETGATPPPRGIRRLHSSQVFNNKQLLRQIKTDQLLVRKKKCTLNSSFADLLVRSNNELNQLMLVDLDVHLIVMEFLSKHSEDFIHSLQPHASHHHNLHQHSADIGDAADPIEQAAKLFNDASPADVDNLDPHKAAQVTAQRLGLHAKAPKQGQRSAAQQQRARRTVAFGGGDMSDEDVSDDSGSESDDSIDREEKQRLVHLQKAPVPTQKRRIIQSIDVQNDYVRVFDLCFLFLRAIIRNNGQTAEKLTTKQTIGLSIALRHYCPEAVHFLCDLIRINKGVVSIMSDQDFIELLKDIKDIVSRDNIDHPLPIYPYGLSLRSTGASLKIITAIGTCAHDLTDQRLRQFRDVLHQELPGSASSITILERFLYMGIGQSLYSTESETYDKTHIMADVRFMTLLYYAETGRTTFSRLPGHVLLDKFLEQSAFESLKPSISNWKLLPEDSVLQLHLNFVAALGSIARYDLGIQKYCLRLVQYPKVIFQLLMIDKYEIRDAYLKLLHGIWFSGLPNSPLPTEMLTFEYKEYMLALFYSFIQDLRLYTFVKKELVAIEIENSAIIPNSFSSPHEQQQQAASAASSDLDDERRQRLAKHGQLLESFVIDTMLPFVKVCTEATLLRKLDFGIFRGGGKSNRAAIGSVSSVDSRLHQSIDADGDNTVPPGSDRTKGISNGTGGLLPCSKRRNRQLLQDYVLELSLILAEALNNDLHVVDALTQSMERSRIAKAILKYGRRYSGYLSSKDQDSSSTYSVHMHVLSRAVDCIDVNEKARFHCTSVVQVQQQEGNTILPSESYARFNTPTTPRSSKAIFEDGDDEGEKLKMLKFNCIQEFIVEVDKFASVHGLRPEHLLHMEEPRTVYIGEQEFTNGPKLETDPNANAGQGNTTKVDIILNPMNSKFFRYATEQVSRIFVSYARHFDESRYQQILSLMAMVNDNREVSLSEMGEAVVILPDFLKQRGGDLVDSIAGLVATASRGGRKHVHRDSLEEFSRAQFQRWSRHGGMFLEKLLQHMLYCLNCYQGNQRMGLVVSFGLDDIIRCNVYWLNIFTKGILRSSIADMYELYSDQTETQLAQVNIETKRLRLMQDTFHTLSAHEVAVKMLSVSADKLRTTINDNSIRLMRHSAIDMSIALTQTGNRFLQDAIIDTIHSDYLLNQSLGISEHFMLSLRLMLQEQAVAFSSGALDPINVLEVRKLLQAASLLCEGHNVKAQTYLGEFKVVVEVANFVHEMSRLLAQEMENYLITPNELSSKSWPMVLQQYRRPIIRWISPMVSSFSSAAEATNYSDYKFLDIERVSLLCELVQAGFEALAEFCQRPCFSNQQAIARAGCANSLRTFFTFFGAYQLINVVQPSAEVDNEMRRHKFAKSFCKQVGVVFSHEAVHPLPAQSLTRHTWIGNDPLAIHLTSSEVTTVPTEEEVGTKLKVRRYHPPESGSLFSCIKGDAQVHHHDLVIRLGSVDDWMSQKEKFHAFLDQHSSNNASGIENNHYFQIHEFGQVLADLEASCLKFAGSLLEGSIMDEDGEVPQIVVNSIGPENLIANMANYWNRYLSFNPLSSIAADDCFERRMAYDYYALVMRITDMTESNFSVMPMVRDWLERTDIDVDKHIARVEVRSPEIDRDTSLVVAYFPIPKVVHNYWTSDEIRVKRDEILYPTNVGTRDSADEKVKTFLKEGATLIATLRHLESLDEIWAVKGPLSHLLVAIAHRQSLWANITFLLTILINLMLIVSVKVDGKSYAVLGNFFNSTSITWSYTIDIILWVHIGLTSMLFFSYVVMQGWLYVKLETKDNPDGEFQWHGRFLKQLGLVLNRIGLLGHDRAVVTGDKVVFHLWPITYRAIYLFFRYETAYYLLLLGSTVAARLVTPLFIAINLVEILRLSKLMQYVTRAFTANIDQVTATVVLAAVLMYMFTTLAYSVNTIRNHYYFDDKGQDEDGNSNGCPTLAACLRLHLDYGLVQAVFWDYEGYIASIEGEFFNFAFVFIMQIVIPGLISGIIIDTFSEMRGNKQAVEEDVANTCFICNIDREDFELVNVPFEQHVHDDHNMWKYLWFMIYLLEKDHTEYDGIEQFCSEIVDVDGFSTRWLPVKMARGLSSLREKYDLFTIVSKITALHARVEKIEPFVQSTTAEQTRMIKEQVKDMSAALAKRMKQQQQQQLRQLNAQNDGAPTPHTNMPIRNMRFSQAEVNTGT